MFRIIAIYILFLPFMVNGQSPPDHKQYSSSISPNTNQDDYKYSARKELRLKPGFTVGDDASTVNSTRLNIHPYIFGPEDDNTDATSGNSSLSPDINQAQPDRSKNEDFLGLSASADNSGGAKVNIPIGLPAGNGGLTPSLVVSSTSPYVDDILGQGMTLVGAISSITLNTRHPIYHESTSLDPLGQEGYFLDGQALISVPEEDHLYIIPNNRDIRVYAKFDSQANLNGFEVRLSNGRVVKYEKSFLTNQYGHGITWLRTREEDVFGNYINYRYKLDLNSILLQEIAYGGKSLDEITKVEFSYNHRLKPKHTYSFGNEVIVEKLLSRVKIKNHNAKLWEYDFSYEKNYDGTYLLRKVDRKNSAGEISQPIELQWHINNANSQYELLENFLEPIVSVHNYNSVIPFPSNNNGVLDYLVIPEYRESYSSTNGYKIVEGGNGDEPQVLFETSNAGVFITSTDKVLKEHFSKEGRWKGLSEKIFNSSSTFFTDFDKDENQDVMYLKQSIQTIETENENGDPVHKTRNIYHLKHKEINELGEVIGDEGEVHPLPYFLDNPDGGICYYQGDFDQNGRQDALILYKGISTDAETGRLDLDFIMDDGTFFRININDFIAQNVPRGSLLIDDITFESTAYFTSDFDKDGDMEIFFYSRNSHEAIFFVEFDFETKSISIPNSNLLSFINDWDIVDNNNGMDLVKIDVNLDGNEDIIIYSPDNNQINIYEGLGNGDFVKSQRSAGAIESFLNGSKESLNQHKIIYDPFFDSNTSEWIYSVRESRRKSKHTHTRFIPGDFNGDGRTDLAIIALKPDDENFFSVGIFENNWQTFRKVNHQDFKDRYFPKGSFPEFRGGHRISVQSVDFNGDGFDELFVEYGFRKSEYKDNKYAGDVETLPIAGSIKHFLIQLNKANTFESELLGENFSKPGLVHSVTDSRTNYEFQYTVPYRYDLEFKNLPNEVGTGGTETAASINGGENTSGTIIEPGFHATDLKDYYSRPLGTTVVSNIKTYQKFNGSMVIVGDDYYQFLEPLVHFRLGSFGYRTIIKWTKTNPGEDNGRFNGSYMVSHFGPFTNKDRKLYEFKPTSTVSGFVKDILDSDNNFNYELRKVSRVENYFYKFKETGPWYYSDLTYTRNEVANYFIDDESVDYEVTFNYFDDGRLLKSDYRSSEKTQVITEYSGFQKPDFWYREILPTTVTTTFGCIVGEYNLCDGIDNPKRPLTKTITYDLSIGLPKKSVDNSNLDAKFQMISEILSRDQFGNVLESSSQESGRDPLLSSMSYSSDGRHVVSGTNPIGDVFNREIDLVYGNVLSETNAKGFTTSSTYDKVGVLQSVTDKNGVVSRVETKWATANDPVYNQISEASDLIVTSRIVDGGVDSWSYMDVYGRTWLTKSADLTSSRNRFVRSYFDKFGRELGNSYPTFSLSDVNTRPKVSEVASFDYKSRPLEVLHFDRNGTFVQNSSISYTYTESNKLFSSKMEWENGNRSLESFYNQKGQKTKVIENGDTQVEYVFNHFDELESIIAPGGAMTQLNYDEIGRQDLLSDPNHGEVTYDYNAFDELILQSDNSGTFSMTYDELGRPVSKHNTANPLESYSWKYSNDGLARGNITETTGPEGYLEQVEYNSEGNPEKRTLNENYTWNSKFDGRDRTTNQSFPSGIELEYVYDQAKGYLQQVKFRDVVLWEKGDDDVFGQPLFNKRFNGLIVDEYAYDNMGSPRFYKTRANGGLMFHWEFEFENESGNLLSREDKLAVGPYSKEYFKYDQYDRLEKVAFNDENNVVLQMEYDDNGNILSKSDISGGVYEYDSGGRPHAVLGINKLAENHGISNNVINYTSFHQPQTISNSDKSFNLSYGADQLRFTMTAPVSWQESSHQVTEKVYLGSEEWLKVDDEWYYNHYVFAGGKFIALIQGKIDSDEQPEIFFPVCDYLGSLYGFIKEDGNGALVLVDQRSYDAWGKLRNPIDWTDKNVNSLSVTNRGYTFHEHLMDAGLINMNGRLYDPAIARMLSPDNYVQDDGNPQNYNRYSYVLNNPLKYTDPSGEIVWMVPIVAAAVFGVGNLAVQASNGEINNFGDGLKAFGSGAVAGFALGTGVAAGLTVPILGTAIKTAGWIYAGSTALSVVSGLGQGIFSGDWSALENSGKIFAGNFYLDGNRSFLGQTWQGISRFSWELPQSTIGHGYSQLRNTFGAVDRVDYFGGATFSTGVNPDKQGWGVSIGNHINIQRRVDRGFDIERDGLLQHEYGHTFDSQIFGPGYLFAVGIPSMSGADWTETRADEHWLNYLLRINR